MRIGVNAGSLERDLLERYGEPCPEAMASSSSRSRARRRTCFSRSPPISSLPRPATTRCISGITEAGGLRSGTNQIIDRARHAAVVRDRRHDADFALRRPGRGGQGRVRDPEIAEFAAPQGHRDLVLVLRAPAVRGDQDRRAARGASRPHHDADDRFGDRLRRQRSRARRARPTSSSPAAATAPIRFTSTA